MIHARRIRVENGSMAARGLLGEKPHQGVRRKNQPPYRPIHRCKLQNALGLLEAYLENGVQQIYRARYYNPNTGRFLSRDPEDGIATDPASLHKYLYAIGDPVNRIDPRGREAMLEVGSLDAIIGTTPVPALVELAGGAYASAASFAVDQYLMYAASTSNLAAAVGDFIEAVDWAELVSGISKVFLCESLQIFLEGKIEEFSGKMPPNIDLIEKAEDKFQEVCWAIAGKAL